MRVFACILAASLAFTSAADAAPTRVASLNLCTDELLLMLAAPEQIASVTHLAHKPEETALWKRARQYSKNDGSLLSAVSFRPDLVVTMGGGARDRIGIARRLGIQVINLPFAQSLADVENSVRLLAQALDRLETGRRIVRRLRQLKQSAPRSGIDTIWLGGGGRSVSAQGLEAQWMALAGMKQRPIAGDRVSLEQLLLSPPLILLRSDYRQGQFSGAQRWLSHPLARGTKRSRNIVTDGRRWTCMGPLLIDEIVRLRKEVAR